MTISLLYLQRENLLISNLCQKGITCEHIECFHERSLQDEVVGHQCCNVALAVDLSVSIKSCFSWFRCHGFLRFHINKLHTVQVE